MPPICPKGNQSRGLDVLAQCQRLSLGWQRQWPDSSPFLSQSESSSQIPLEEGWRYTHPYSSSVWARNLVLVFSHYPLPRHWGITQEQNVTFTWHRAGTQSEEWKGQLLEDHIGQKAEIEITIKQNPPHHPLHTGRMFLNKEEYWVPRVFQV